MSRPRVCVIVKAWPRISTTFVAQELLGLEQAGLDLAIASLGPGEARHPLHDQIRAPILYLPEPWRAPRRILGAWRKVRRTAGYARARSLFARDMRRGSPVRRTVRLVHFLQALALVAELPEGTAILYAHFILGAGTCGRYASAITGLRFVASAHAKDIWTLPAWDKRAKLAAMAWCATCTRPGAEHLAALADDPAKVHLIYHGLSFSRFPSDAPARPARDGSDPDAPVELLTIGRAVEKKGFDTLVEALAMLPDDLHWRLHHVGGGPRLGALRHKAESLGLAARIAWHGIEDQTAVIARYRACDLFVLPSRKAGNGDRDGLPNVLMEAQSQALACLSTRFSAIPELIDDGATGVLVPPGDAPALAAAMERLIRTPAERERLGLAGFHRVRRDFEAEDGIARIAALLRGTMAARVA